MDVPNYKILSPTLEPGVGNHLIMSLFAAFTATFKESVAGSII